VRAVLRRRFGDSAESEILRVGNVMLDRSGRIVKVDNKTIDLTPSEFGLLSTLMSSPGRAFSRLDLLERTSGDTFDGYERTIDVHIRNLRSKIEPSPSKPIYVQTVYGMGYRFRKEEGNKK
ncbi:MAG: winged helix-turn-helix domain-containing protein, partial [Candidatus Promineifilaceae bacterium]